MSRPDVTFVGLDEIAELAGVKVDTVKAWQVRHDTFPAPVATLDIGPLWDWDEVKAWILPGPAETCMGCGTDDEDVLDHYLIDVGSLVHLAVCANCKRRYEVGQEGYEKGLNHALTDVATYIAAHCR